MTEEVAGMAPGTLREVVLSLVCPEGPPLLQASSEVDLREQEATAMLRPPEALRLQRSPVAIKLLNRFAAQPALLDEIADLFLSITETYAHILVFEEVRYAYEVVRLGASPATMERMMVQLVLGGYRREAEELAGLLKRPLSHDEVLGLVRSYTNGAVYSRQSDQEWPQFAERHLGPEGRHLAQQEINERNERLRHQPD